MRFFLITKNNKIASTTPPMQPKYFKDACAELGIEFVELNADIIDFNKVPTLEKGDLLYRNATTRRAIILERVLINESCTTFFHDWNQAFNDRGSSMHQNMLAGLPIIPSYPALPKTREEANTAVEALGGYPVVLKVLGGSKGVGVIRVDSQGGMNSLTDYFAKNTAKILIRKFIPHEYYGRLIVVGDTVVASNRTEVPQSDFRSNTTDNIDDNRKAHVFDGLSQKIAVDAVRSIGLDFGGVDLLFDEENKPYIAEINFPCQFNIAQELTGIDIAKLMVEFLRDKANTSS